MMSFRVSESAKWELIQCCLLLGQIRAQNPSLGWRQWHPTPVFSPGKSHGWRSLVGCSPWGRYESDTTERLHLHFSLSCIGEGHAIHSSILAWTIPGTEEPVGCRLWDRTELDTITRLSSSSSRPLRTACRLEGVLSSQPQRISFLHVHVDWQ